MNKLGHNPVPSAPAQGRGIVLSETNSVALPGLGKCPASRRRAEAESAARAMIEVRCGHSLTDKEWVQQRSRLIEFFRTLARWDSGQQSGSATNSDEARGVRKHA